jgi:alcohol dehydrogenase YqhD (iron-dependent ADH family)
MISYFYHTPTKIVFGKDAEMKVGELTKDLGYKKVLVHYGGGSAKRSGLIGRVEDSLKKVEISYVELGGVVPNPRLSLVYEGIELVRREHVDLILAVGGGSVIDSAKAIGSGVACGGDVWDFYTAKRVPDACVPIATVLTIAATGSEMSSASVITNTDGDLKRAVYNEASRPVFAAMNPEITMTLPDYHTASGCVDILMHTMERYFNNSDNMEITDGISEALMRTVIKNALILVNEPKNYKARAEVMWAGSLSHNGLTGCGTDGGDWATHKLEHELGGLYDVAHGAGLSAIWGSWARYVCNNRLDRFVKFTTEVMGVSIKRTIEETVEAGIKAAEDLFTSLHMPVSMKELGVDPTDEQIEEMAKKCFSGVGGKLGVVKRLEVEDIIAIYKKAR